MNERKQVLKRHCRTHAVPIRFSAHSLELLDLAYTHKSYDSRKMPQNNPLAKNKDKPSLHERICEALNTTTAKCRVLSKAASHKIQTKAFSNQAKNNEQLEFLGDAALSLIITEYLMQRFPDKLEGFLSRIKSYVVSRNALYYIASMLELHTILKCNASVLQAWQRDTEKSPPPISPLTRQTRSHVYSPLANAVEALLGALYLSEGINTTRSFIIRHFAPIVDSVIKGTHHRDYKSMLQHHTQSTYGVKPVYTITHISGPEHEKQYAVAVSINNNNETVTHTFISSKAYNKKQAEQNAAKVACKALNVLENEVLF